MKKILFLAMSAIAASAPADGPKYVFLFVGDGMSVPQRMTAEEFSRKTGAGSLAMNAMPYSGITRTCSTDSLVTDSAAAATAIACGVKTYNCAIGVDASRKPVLSCAEAAKKAGRKVGIVTTTTITHATPAGFYAHRPNRADTYGIARDLADSGFDFFAGGGLNAADEGSPDSNRRIERGDVRGYIRSRGYRIVDSRDSFMSLKPGDGKVVATFSDHHFPFAIDSDGLRPTLAEMVSKAVEMLDGPDGFFIMAEGGVVDHSAHANDAATNLRELLAMDAAVKVACAFRERHPDETLVVVTGDHETGGMSMGFAKTAGHVHTEWLTNQTMSVHSFSRRMTAMMDANPELKFDDVKPLVCKAFGLKFCGNRKKDPMVLSATETADLKKAFDHDAKIHRAGVKENLKYDAKKAYRLGYACCAAVSHKCGIGWSSGSHTAMPTLTTAAGCGAERFAGFMENAGIGVAIKGFYE